jgi:hypothetical protein
MPAAVGLAFHGRGLGMPVVEVADQGDAFGPVGGTNEIDGLDGFGG